MADEVQVVYLKETDGVDLHGTSSEVMGNDAGYVSPEREREDHFLVFYFYQGNEDEGEMEDEGMTVVSVVTQENTEVDKVLEQTSCPLTIVPSEGNAAEVSYVLVIGNPDDKDEKKEDLKEYHFDENGDDMEEAQTEREEEIEDVKLMKGETILPKSETAPLAHMCNLCNYTSSKRYLLSRHMKSHSEERPHKCSFCARGFKSRAALRDHVNIHTGTKRHNCKYCDSAFTTSGELVRHVRYRHTHEKPHQCSECDYTSVEKSKLKRHMRVHTGDRPYQCPDCTYASPDTCKLKRHLCVHTGEKPYECDICQARFTQSSSLKAHRRIHSGNKPVVKCELCPSTFGRKTDLRIHIKKLHTSEVLLKCKRCEKSFPDRYTLKTHCKTHDGEKFQCHVCPYAASSPRWLQSHLLVHTGQKPFECQLCGQSFRQKQLLKRHENLYHDPNYIPPQPRDKQLKCSECGRSFLHNGNLIRHMAIHDPGSSANEKALALKLGRQKGMKISQGRHVEDDDEDGVEVLAVEGEDEQQYVVLEVIHLQDEEGVEQTVAVIDENTQLWTEVLKSVSNIGDLNDSAIMEEINEDPNKSDSEGQDTPRVGISQ